MKVYKPKAVAERGRFALLVCRQGDVTPIKLYEGLKDSLLRQGSSLRTFDVYYLNHSPFLPLMARELSYTGHYDVLFCLALVDESRADVLTGQLEQVMLDGRTLVVPLFAGSEEEGEAKAAESARAALEGLNLIEHIRGMEEQR